MVSVKLLGHFSDFQSVACTRKEGQMGSCWAVGEGEEVIQAQQHLGLLGKQEEGGKQK